MVLTGQSEALGLSEHGEWTVLLGKLGCGSPPEGGLALAPRRLNQGVLQRGAGGGMLGGHGQHVSASVPLGGSVAMYFAQQEWGGIRRQ